LEPIPDYVDTTAITWLKIRSDTKLSNQEVTYALESNADVELRKVAETALQNR